MKILIQENKNKINEFSASLNADLNRTEGILSIIWKHHKADLPDDPNQFLKELFYENPSVKTMASWMRIDLNSPDIILPDNIREMKQAFAEWQSGAKKNFRFFNRTKTGWIRDQKAINEYFESFAENHRVYAETPDELDRYRRAKTYCDIVEEIINEKQVDLKYGDTIGLFKNNVRNFLCEFREHRFHPNVQYIKTGIMQ